MSNALLFAALTDWLWAQAWWLALLGVVFVLVIGWRGGVAWSRWRRGRLVRRHAARGERGEQLAERLLAQAGYQIVERQVPLMVTVHIDEQPHTARIVADCVVEGNDGRWVAEIKNGHLAARVSRRDTRRQLLEYVWATGASGVLLVDVPGRRVVRVAFPPVVGSTWAQR